jgi:hypothetical protein
LFVLELQSLLLFVRERRLSLLLVLPSHVRCRNHRVAAENDWEPETGRQ